MLKRTASAHWEGTGAEGSGHISSTSGVLNQTPYSFATRFKSEDGRAGTNPEELIASAHAACFTMALSFGLAGAGFTPESLDTKATVEMEQQPAGGFAISKITLNLTGSATGATPEQFAEAAQKAKEGCPISKALSAVPIELVIG